MIARAEAGAADPALRAALEARQNPDGGFGGGPGFASTALDTAYALAALPDGGGASAALAYLRARQRPDGGFALDDQAQGSAYATAAALMALHAHRLGYDLAQPLARAAGFLLAARGQDGGWGEDFETAWALLALAPATTDRAALAPAAQAVADAQQADGSWGGDVYRTALAARALLAVGKAGGGQSAAGTVTDRVADQAGGLSAETAADGRFSLPGLAPGELSVGFALAGYADAARAAMLEAGQRLDLGTVALAGGVRV